MILSCQNLFKSFGAEQIVTDASFHLQEHQKAALVGINGAGKTTILNMIAGEIEPDSGSVSIAKGTKIGYLRQHQESDSNATIYSELLEGKRDLLQMEGQLRKLEQEMRHSDGTALKCLLEQYNRVQTEFEDRGGYSIKSEATGILKGLGFSEEEFDKPVSTLSGGQKTRVALGRLLFLKPDLLLLDEPTNHLDLKSIAWLETYLMNAGSAMLIVAHDRYFLNRVVAKVIELDQGKVQSFDGNYTDYAQKKARQRDARWRAYVNQQREIRRQEAVITKLKSFNREKSVRRAESREKLLSRMDAPEKPSEADDRMRLHFAPRYESGKDVLDVQGLSKCYPGTFLFEQLDFSIRRGEKVALIGDNGTGKTTILKILTGMETADAGTVLTGSRVRIAYYDQEHQLLHPEKTVYDEISDLYPAMTQTEIRTVLASFLFIGDEVFKQVAALSGGERGRLSLARLMLSEANFLILDEPTNHLDLTSKEILEEAIRNYEGTVLYVSHDRYFINQTAQRILELKNHKLNHYLGNYDDYLEKSEELAGHSAPGPARETADLEDSSAKADWERRKREQARRRKITNELKQTEERIGALEQRDREIDALLVREEVFTDPKRCAELGREKRELEEELEQLYGDWENLCELDTEKHV